MIGFKIRNQFDSNKLKKIKYWTVISAKLIIKKTTILLVMKDDKAIF